MGWEHLSASSCLRFSSNLVPRMVTIERAPLQWCKTTSFVVKSYRQFGACWLFAGTYRPVATLFFPCQWLAIPRISSLSAYMSIPPVFALLGNSAFIRGTGLPPGYTKTGPNRTALSTISTRKTHLCHEALPTTPKDSLGFVGVPPLAGSCFKGGCVWKKTQRKTDEEIVYKRSTKVKRVKIWYTIFNLILFGRYWNCLTQFKDLWSYCS